MNLSTSSTKIVAPPTVTSIGIGENSPDMNDAVDGAISVLLFILCQLVLRECDNCDSAFEWHVV